MNTFDENGKLIAFDEKKPSAFSRFVPAVGLTSAVVMSSQANAAILDLTALNTEFTSIQTSVVGIIAVAVTIGIAIVGWRWAKRALFSI